MSETQTLDAIRRLSHELAELRKMTADAAANDRARERAFDALYDELKQYKDREHILEGLTLALDYIDEVIKIIRGSATVDEAREGLITREQGLELIQEENQPRFFSIQQYCELIGVDFENAIRSINRIPTLYPS